jgi:2-polyprenyl-3-methyl-5-hydroxy-6-metoxy-1,4-benzoquinol methylase
MHDRLSARCPSCGGRDVRSRFFGARVSGYRVLQCRACGLAFCWPRPTEDELTAFYAAEYFSGDNAKGYRSYGEWPEANARRQWYELRARYFGVITERGSVLDVGCASGGFLAEAAANGWDAYGTDISQEAANAARATYGLRVDAETLIPGDSTLRFDLITLWHVLEHLVEPRSALENICQSLATDGLLFIEVPNWHSVGRLVRGRRWAQLRPPEHITFFSGQSLRALLADVGMTVVRSTTTYPSLVDQAQASGTRSARARAWIGQGLAYAGAGGYLSVLAQKAT